MSDSSKPVRAGGVARRYPAWVDGALIILAILPLFVRLDAPTATGSEGRWLAIAARMHATGDWSRPVLGTAVYWDKPLLSYIAIAALGAPFDHIDEAIARLPGALCSAVTVLLTAWLAARLFGRRSAVLAAWILATSFSFFVWSRTASADPHNLMFTTAAIAVYVASLRRVRAWHVLLFFAILAVGGHAKGMTAVLVPLGVVGMDHVVSRRLDWLRRWKLVAVGALGAAALYLLPMVVDRWRTGSWEALAAVWRENFLRGFESFDHNDENATYYLYTVLFMFLPWSLWLPQGIAWGVARFRKHAGSRFTLTAFVTIFLFFTLSQSRRSYYILPVFPFAALLVASFLAELDAVRAEGTTAARRWLAAAVVPLAVFAVGIAAGALYLVGGRLLPGKAGEIPRLLPDAIPLGLLLAACVAAMVIAWRRAPVIGRFLAAGAIAILACGYFAYDVGDLRTLTLSEKPFGAELRARYPKRRIIYYRFTSARLDYYLGPGPRVRNPEELRRAVEPQPEVALVVCEPRKLAEVENSEGLATKVLLEGSTHAFGTILPARITYYALECLPRPQ